MNNKRKLTLSWLPENVDNPDLRDRGFIYWRLLSADPQAAKAIVLSEKPLKDTGLMDNLEPSLLDELMYHIGSLASVYHKPPSSFLGAVSSRAKKSAQAAQDVDKDDETALAGNKVAVIADDVFGSGPSKASVGVSVGGGGIMNLLDLDMNDYASEQSESLGSGSISNSVGSPSSGLNDLNCIFDTHVLFFVFFFLRFGGLTFFFFCA